MSEPYITITLDGAPVGKGRPRARMVTPRGKPSFIHFYSEKATAEYEERLKAAAQRLMWNLDVLEEPLGVTVDAYVPIPVSWPQRDRDAALAGRLCPGKPDADNYLKIVDALNGVVWKDDSQIVRAVVTKYYSGQPRLVIAVHRWLR